MPLPSKDKTVHVFCTRPGGMVLRQYEQRPEEMGVLRAIRIGEPVKLHYGDNEVNAEWMAAWQTQHGADGEAALGLIVTQPDKGGKKDKGNG